MLEIPRGTPDFINPVERLIESLPTPQLIAQICSPEFEREFTINGFSIQLLSYGKKACEIIQVHPGYTQTTRVFDLSKPNSCDWLYVQEDLEVQTAKRPKIPSKAYFLRQDYRTSPILILAPDLLEGSINPLPQTEGFRVYLNLHSLRQILNTLKQA